MKGCRVIGGLLQRKFQFIVLLLIGLRPMQCFASWGYGLPRRYAPRNDVVFCYAKHLFRCVNHRKHTSLRASSQTGVAIRSPVIRRITTPKGRSLYFPQRYDKYKFEAAACKRGLAVWPDPFDHTYISFPQPASTAEDRRHLQWLCHQLSAHRFPACR